MLNYLWAAMILLGVIWGAFTGNMEPITNGVIESAKEAVTIAITMLGIVSMWTGLMEVAKESGIIKRLTRAISPMVHFLFPEIPREHPAREYISTNFIANILGLGWAATPAGLKAMESLQELNIEECKKPETKRGIESASDAMCTFMIMNISSLQLIPVNMIAYRSQYGSANPAAVVGPAIAATLISTIAGVVFVKLMRWK